jgi:hypothetical protein
MQEEALIMAREIDGREGHFGRGAIKEKLIDKIKSPYLDQTILTAIRECGRCKGFSNTHLHSLLEPIMHRHPGELLVGDYCSISKGKGRFNNLGIYLDVFSRHTTVYTYKKSGTGLTTVNALQISATDLLIPRQSWLTADRISTTMRSRNSVRNVASNYTLWLSTHCGSTVWWKAPTKSYWVY